MNSAQNDGVPDLVNPTWEDAVFAMGLGANLLAGPDQGNTYGNAALITATQALTARHLFQDLSSGYHTLAAGELVLRSRRLLNGTAPVNGTHAGSFDVGVAGVRIPSSGDAALLDLVTPVTHITPLAVDTGHPVAGDPLRMAGWGSTSATYPTVVMPLDARVISSKTASSVLSDVNGRAQAIFFSGVNPGPNIYDSGGAVLRQVGGVWKVCGVISAFNGATAIEQYAHDAAFQIPGLYTPAAAAAADPTTWLHSADTCIDQGSPTADNSALTTFSVYQLTGKGGNIIIPVLAGFDSSGIAGRISAARLVLRAASAATAGTLRFRRLRRAATALANWNTYDGVNPWGTAGAQNTASDVYTANQFTFEVDGTQVNGSTLTITDPGLLAMLNDARAEGVPLAMICERLADGVLQVYSNDATDPALRPRLEVSSVDPADWWRKKRRAARGR